MENLKLWWYRNFVVISNQKAKEIGLIFFRNLYGNEMNCRSIWFDHKYREYRVRNFEQI